MKNRRFSLPFGESQISFSVLPPWEVDELHPSTPPTESAGGDWLPGPEDTFAQAVRKAARAVIVFTDATRASPDLLLAKQALQDLLEAGMPANRIAFLCAVGMHRPSTPEEKRAKLGAAIVSRFPVLDHDPADAITIGRVADIPVQVNRLLTGAGTLVVGLGVVEPHQYAGYSGGAKTVVIGCAGGNTIAATHGPRFLNQEGVRLGRIEGNPFQAFVREAGRMVNLVRVYNAVLDETHAPRWFMGGPPDAVHDALVARARALCEIPAAAPYDVVIAGVGAPKDANLYQASRAATYIGLSARPVIRPGGVIVLPAPLPEGAGQGQGEQNFIRALAENSDLSALLARLEAEGCQPGEQRAYMVAQLLRQYRVIVVGAKRPDAVKRAHLAPVETMDEALDLARVWCGTLDRPPRLLVVPNALQMLPVPQEASPAPPR